MNFNGEIKAAVSAISMASIILLQSPAFADYDRTNQCNTPDGTYMVKGGLQPSGTACSVETANGTQIGFIQ